MLYPVPTGKYLSDDGTFKIVSNVINDGSVLLTKLEQNVANSNNV
jgi:hypothetical protein